MLERFRDWIKRIFGKRPLEREEERFNRDFAKKYEDIRHINFGAIFSNALSNKVCADSTVLVDGENGQPNERAELINDVVQKLWKKSKKITAQALGKGGKFIIPYVKAGNIYCDTVDQSRVTISAVSGDEITGATILADIIKSDTTDNVYFRWTDYTLENGVETIRTTATTDRLAPIRLETIPDWADMEEEITITNVEHSLFAYLKSPVDNRRDKDIYGVPITFGSEDIIDQLHNCMADIEREYEAKKVFVGVDDTLWGKNDKLPRNGLFKVFRSAGSLNSEAMWQVFDPAIRDSAYKARYDMLCAQLEQSVGTSRGILTEPYTAAATATEIKTANYATFCLIDDIRNAWEKAMNDFAYACDVLAEAFGLTPAGARGRYKVSFDWDMSHLESTTETFSQLSELESRNLISGARLAAWVTGDSTEEAQAEIDAVQAAAPAAILGGAGYAE